MLIYASFVRGNDPSLYQIYSSLTVLSAYENHESCYFSHRYNGSCYHFHLIFHLS